MIIEVQPDGTLTWHGQQVRCALGRGGIAREKQEGDGATPAGNFPLREVFYRPDRLEIPETRLPIRPIAQTDGWCDDPESGDYNRRIDLPHPARHETLWRDAVLYDLVVVVGYNDDPPVPGRGSAIFMHLAKPDFAPTEGCVALERADLLALLKDCDGETRLTVTLSED